MMHPRQFYDASPPCWRRITLEHLTRLLSSILIRVADHLTDRYTSQLPGIMVLQHDLSPTSPQWLHNWDGLLSNETLISPRDR
jgi:tuberous sclerosis protein 2